MRKFNFKTILPIFLVLTLALSQDSLVGNVVVTVNETFRLDLSQYIEGDFLSFTSNASNINATSKFEKLSSTFYNISSIDFTLTNLPRDNIGNLLTNFYGAFLDNSNLLYWAVIVDEFTAPNVPSVGFNFTQSSNTTCYDLAVVNNDTIIVDCMNYSSGLQQNWLFTVSISQQAVTGVTPTYFYYNTTGTERFLRFYNTTEVGYLYRTTYQGSVDSFDFSNTVIEIFSLANTSNPYPYWVIDRTALNATTLSINGFDVYLGDVILVDYYNATIYRVTGYLGDPSYAYSYTFQLPDQAPTSLRVVTSAAWGDSWVSVLVANNAYLYEISWTNFTTPSLWGRYSYPVAEIGSASPITTSPTPPDASAHFLYLPLISGANSYYAIFRRGQYAGQNIHYLLTTSSPDQTFFIVSRWSETVFYITNSSANVVQINLPYLTFPNILPSTNGACLAVNVSILFANQTNSSVIFPYYVINQTDYNIYYTGEQQINSVIGSSPGVPITTEFGGIVSGPLPQFSSSNSSATFTLKENVTSFNYGYTGNFTYFQEDPQNPGSYLFFVQGNSNANSSNTTEYTLNTYSYDGTSFSLIGLNTLTGPIYKIAVGLGYFVVVTWDQPTVVQGWYWNSATSAAQFNIATIVPVGCTDLEAIYSEGTATIVCVAPVPKNIYLWTNFIQNSNQAIVINKGLLGLQLFSPTEVEISPTYPNYLFVNTGLNQVLVIDIGLIPINGEASIFTTINYPEYLGLPKSGNRILIVDNALVILAFNGSGTSGFGILEEWDISDINSPLLRKDISYPGLFSLPNYTANIYDYSFASSDKTSSYYVTLADSNNTAWIFDFTAGIGGNNLYQIVAYNTNISNILSVGVVSVDSNTDLVALATPTGITVYNIYAAPVLTWQPYLSDSALSGSTSNFDITVSGFIAGNTSKPYSQPIQATVVNTQYPISLIGNASNSPLTTLQNYSQKALPALFSVDDSNIFNGTVLNYTVAVSNQTDLTSGKLQFIPKVNSNTTLINLPFNIYDVYNDNTNFGYVLTNNRLIRTQGQDIYDWTDLSFAGVNFNNEECSRVVAHESELYSASFCFDPVTKVQWLVLVSYLSSHPTIFYAAPTIVAHLNSIQIVDSYIFVLESDPENYQTTPARLHIFSITLGSGSLTPVSYLTLIDGSTFGIDQLSSGGFSVGSFEFNNSTIYRIFISEASIGLLSIDFNSATGSLVNTYTNDLTTDPAFNGQLTNNVVFTGVGLISANLTTGTWELLIITENSNAFTISWTLNANVTTPLINVYQGFLNFQGYTNLNVFDYIVNSVSDIFIGIVAENPIDQSRYVLVYDATSNSNTPVTTGATGGVKYSTLLGNTPYVTASPHASALQVWGNPTDTSFKLWTPLVNSSFGAIGEYDLRLQLSFNITGNLSSNSINLTAVNSLGSTSVSFLVGNQPTNNSNSGSVLWIIFLVIILVLVIILMVFAVKKCRPQADENADPESAKSGLIANPA